MTRRLRFGEAFFPRARIEGKSDAILANTGENAWM